MDSPRFYDLSPGTPEKSKLITCNFVPQQTLNHLTTDIESEITNLDSQELSFDLNNFIGEKTSTNLFSDILEESSKVTTVGLASSSGPALTNAASPLYTRGQAAGYINAVNNSYDYHQELSYTTLQIKREPENERCRQEHLVSGGALIGNNNNYHTSNYHSLEAGGSSDLVVSGSESTNDLLKLPSTSKGRSKKNSDKSTDEYRKRRERNNIAVRKSREKAKKRSRFTEERVTELAKDNENLQRKVEVLTKELNVLRSLFTNVGGLPEGLNAEIAKTMSIDQSPSCTNFRMEQ